MAKALIDVPEVGYKTWLISTHYIDNNGNYVEDDNGLDSSKQYPYNERNGHIR